MSPADFFAKIGPAARESMMITDVPAGFVCAQAALESGWGTSGLCVKDNNLFGVKADASWKGPVDHMLTHEYVNQRNIVVDAPWRVFSSWEASITDHASFFHDNARYAPAFKTLSSIQFATAIAAAGYATDPEYGSKLVVLIQEHQLAQFDIPISEPPVVYAVRQAPVNW